MPETIHKNVRPGIVPPSATKATINRVVVNPTPSLRYHLVSAGRDIAIVAGLAAVAFVSSDDFANTLSQHPSLAAWVPVLQLAGRILLAAYAKTKIATK